MNTKFCYATATGLSSLLGIKHDKITQQLLKGIYNSKFLWQYVKPYIKEVTQSEELIALSFNDSIEENVIVMKVN